MFVKKNNDNRPYLDILISGFKILALIDSGSTASILGSSGLYLLQKIKVPIQYENYLNVTTADGTPQDVLGYISVPITLNNVTKIMKILIIPSLNHSFILGVDFLKNFQINVNFNDLSYHSPISTLCTVNTIQSVQDLSSTENKALEKVTKMFCEIAPTDRLGRTSLISHSIDTGDAKPIRQRQYPLSPAMQQHLNTEIDEMLKMGVIQPSKSPWCSPLWLVEKRSGEYRVCFDGRKLNSVTIDDSYPMPLIDCILNKLRDAKFLTSIDLKNAFFQIPLDIDSRPKTAFAVYGKGLFEFCVMPFGLNNSPKTMARLMDQVIGPSLEPFCFSYLDDIIIATPDFPTHLEILQKVFSRLKDANLTVNLKKCQFCRPSLTFLGFVVDQQGLRTDPEKVSAIMNYSVPKTTTEIKRLIGLVSWYRRFIKDFSTICSPISDLLHGRKKGQSITWTTEADQAFNEIKRRLTSAPVLASPDFTKPFIIQCDASNTAVGSILYQASDGIEHPVAYASRTLNKCERKYSTTEKELAALLFSLEKFRSYVQGTRFTVETDHASLLWLTKISNPTGRLARWAIRLSQFSFDIVHRKGSLNVVADALSRSISETAVLDLSTLNPDKWYISMLIKVKENPEKYPSYRVEKNILYKHIFNNHAIMSNVTDWKIVVPTKNRAEIFRMYHNDATAGHLGVSKTLSRILELYYWPNIRREVYKYVRKCVICAANKSTNLPRAGLMGAYRNINFPFQLISADLLGPYPRSKNGNRYVLVVVDWFTKYVLVRPLSRATSSAIIKFLENDVFLVYGVPQIFVCDNGSQFTSREFTKLMEKYKVQKVWYNANYHPQVNFTERVNRVIVTAIRSYVNENHKNWDMSIYQVAQAIRLAKHDVTGYPPAFLNFARNIPLSGDYYGKFSENANNVFTIGEKNQLINDLQELPNLYVEVRKRLLQAYQRNVKHYNLRKRSLRFFPGDRVWKRNYTLSDAANNYAAKLAPRYIPCIVKKVLSKLVYNLTDLEGNNVGNWHIKDLKTDYTDLDSDDDSDPEDGMDIVD